MIKTDNEMEKLQEFVLDESAASNERIQRLSSKIRALESENKAKDDEIAYLVESVKEGKHLLSIAHEHISKFRAESEQQNALIARLQGSPQAYRINRPVPGSRPFSPVQEDGGSRPAAMRPPPCIKRARDEEDIFEGAWSSSDEEEDEERAAADRRFNRRCSRRARKGGRQEEEEEDE